MERHQPQRSFVKGVPLLPPSLPMFLNPEIEPRDHSSCALQYDELEHWLCATWRGYVDPAEAMHGAQAYLRHATHTPSALR